MADIVNEYFRRFYPADHKDAWETEYCAGTYGRRYTGKSGSNIFPEMVCADGFKMSVQGHFGGYSTPRDDFADRGYVAVEVMTAPNAEPLLDERGGETNDDWSLYGYVPVSIIERVIEKHGGLKAESP